MNFLKYAGLLGNVKTRVIIVGVLFLVSLFVGIFFSARETSGRPSIFETDKGISDFSEGWNRLDDDKSPSPVALPAKLPAESNEKITVTRILDSRFGENMVVFFYSSYQLVSARVDGNDIFPQERQTRASSGWFYIYVPAGSAGRTLAITFSSPYSIFGGNLPKMSAGNAHDVLRWTVARFVPYAIASAILFIAAVFEIFFNLNLKKKNVPGKSNRPRTLQLNTGIFALLYSVFLFCNTTLLPQMLLGRETATEMTTLALMLLPFAFISLSELWSDRLRPFFNLMFLLSTVNFVVTLLLVAFGVASYAETIFTTFILLAVTGSLTVASGLFQALFIRNKSRDDILMITGKTILSGSILIDSVYCVLSRHIGATFVSITGIFIFAFIEIVLTRTKLSRYDAEMALAKAQLEESGYRIAISQIQPHFIGNTLGAIRSLVRKDPDKAYDALYDFSKYLRQNINSIGSNEPIPFSRELDHIKKYIGLEKLRFGDELHFDFDIQFSDFLISPLSIQPFVENSIKHGICKRTGGGTVFLQTFRDGDFANVKIIDDGVGFDVDSVLGAPAGDSIGIRNIKYRLENTMSAKVSISSILGVGTVVDIAFPLKDTPRA